jgi:NAD(P)-dependent dehydrogenase (short-subunit alcohol dehydrogenase family)
MQIEGSAAIVTGGASGLGEATVRALARRGARVVIVDRDEARGGALAAELGEGVRFCKADVTEPAEVQSAVDVATGMGALRVLVQCAGVGWAARTLNKEGAPHDFDLFKNVVSINLVGTFNVLRLCAAAMARNAPDADGQRGAIVNTASVAAFDGQIGQAAYAASKAGIAGMTLPVARDLSAVGIRVNTIAPGTFDTPMLAMLPEAARAALAAGIPFPRRLGQPAEYAALALHLIDNGYVNGETIRLDGALRMPPK